MMPVFLSLFFTNVPHGTIKLNNMEGFGSIFGNVIGQGLLNTGFGVLGSMVDRMNYNYMNRQNTKNWQMVNAYNSPLSQVERLKAAGLSPALMYGGHGQQAQSAPIQPATMPNSEKFGMNKAVMAYTMQQGIEQLRSIQLQNEKTKAETSKVQAETDTVKQNYNVDSQTLLERKRVETDALVQQIRQGNASTTETYQRIQNLKANYDKILADTKLQLIESQHRDRILSGNTMLQQKQMAQIDNQISKIAAEVRSINLHTAQDKESFGVRMRHIDKQIESLSLGNVHQSTANYFQYRDLENRQLQAQSKTGSMDDLLKYQKTLPPNVRYIVDKLMESGWISPRHTTNRTYNNTTHNWIRD